MITGMAGDLNVCHISLTFPAPTELVSVYWVLDKKKTIIPMFSMITGTVLDDNE